MFAPEVVTTATCVLDNLGVWLHDFSGRFWSEKPTRVRDVCSLLSRTIPGCLGGDRAVSSGPDGDVCAICHGDDDGGWVEKCCGHRFHGDCIRRCTEPSRCPICRKVFGCEIESARILDHAPADPLAFPFRPYEIIPYETGESMVGRCIGGYSTSFCSRVVRSGVEIVAYVDIVVDNYRPVLMLRCLLFFVDDYAERLQHLDILLDGLSTSSLLMLLEQHAAEYGDFVDAIFRVLRYPPEKNGGGEVDVVSEELAVVEID